MWDSAARAAASERPTLRQTTALPASAQRSSAATNSAGRRTVSRNRPTALRPLVLGEEREVVGGVRHGLRPRRDDAAEADAAAERQERVGDRPGLAEDGRRCPRRSSRAACRSTPSARPARRRPCSSGRPWTRRPRVRGRRAARRWAPPRSRPPRRPPARRRPAPRRRPRPRTPARRARGSRAARRSPGSRAGRRRSGSIARPPTSSRFGFTPQAGTPLRTTVSTASTLRGDAPTTASERGKRRERTPGTARILSVRSPRWCTRSASRSGGATSTRTST